MVAGSPGYQWRTVIDESTRPHDMEWNCRCVVAENFKDARESFDSSNSKVSETPESRFLDGTPVLTFPENLE